MHSQEEHDPGVTLVNHDNRKRLSGYIKRVWCMYPSELLTMIVRRAIDFEPNAIAKY